MPKYLVTFSVIEKEETTTYYELILHADNPQDAKNKVEHHWDSRQYTDALTELDSDCDTSDDVDIDEVEELDDDGKEDELPVKGKPEDFGLVAQSLFD